MSLKKKVKISVLMPAYNASRFVKEAITSVLYQNCRNFELLLLDDGSSDNTYDILMKYNGHPNVRIYKNKKNQGPGAARNKLLYLAKGEYISPCDADDLMVQGNLETLSNFLNTHPNIGAVYGDILTMEMDKRGEIIKPPSIRGDDCNKKWDLLMNVVNYPGSMIRKSFLLKVSGADETVYSSQGWALYLKLAEVTKIKYLNNQIFYIYRRRPNGVSRNKKWRYDALKVINSAVERRYSRGLHI
jgi:glycosyltransferase involved in cell wall biosynthesis